MGRKLPLNVTIDTIVLKDFPVGTLQMLTLNPKLVNYSGGPLYCHVKQDAAGNTSIEIDEVPPSSYAPATGPIVSVKYTYTSAGTSTSQKQKWDVSTLGLSYSPATPVEHKLVFTAPTGSTAPPDLSLATLQLTQLQAFPSTKNSLGMIVLGHQITGDKPMGYFVSIPMDIDKTVDPTEYAAIGISWTPDLGIAGPIGGGTVP